MITFHLLEKTFVAVFASGMRHVVVAKRHDVQQSDTIRMVSDDIGCAIACQALEITHHDKHNDLMTLTISDYEEIDYDICD